MPFSALIMFYMVACTSIFADTPSLKTPRFEQVKNLYVTVPQKQQSASADAKDPKKITLEVDLPDKQEILARAFDVFAQHVRLTVPDPVNLDLSFLKKMDFFTNGQENQNLLSILNKTETQGGHAMLATMLTLPTHNVERLQKNQAIIQYLLEHPDLAQEIEEQLQILAQTEPHFFSYSADEPSSNQELYKKVYFGSWLSYLNDSPVALETIHRVANTLQVTMATLLPLMAFMIGNTAHKINAALRGDDISYAQATVRNIKAIPSYISALSPRLKTFKEMSLKEMENKWDTGKWSSHQYFSAKVPQTLGDVLHIADTEDPNNKARWFLGGYAAFLTGSQLYLTYSVYKGFNEINHINCYLQERLIGIASYLKAAKKLYHLTEQHSVLLEMPLIKHLAALLNPEKHFSYNAQKLLNLLEHNTFIGAPSFFSLSGRVLAAHTLMHQVKHEFAPVIAAASMFDTFASHAKVFAAHQNTPVKCCFVQFVGRAAPYIEAQNFWHPLLAPETAVPNDIILGNNEVQNFILTGANTGGKSTILKGLILLATLGQTFGYAFADQVNITPFVVINCYLNITDDITSGQSTFAAETERAKKLLADVEGALKQYGRCACLTVIDEIFSGTSPDVGQQAAYYFAERLGKLSNSIVGIATHFKELGSLEQTSTYNNFNVVAYKNEEGKWIRPFKLFDGVSTTNIALELLEDEGIISRSAACTT